MLYIDYDRTANVFVDVNVGTKNHNSTFLNFFDKNNIMIEVQILKFMQEFIFSINVECLHSSLQEKTTNA